MKRRREMLRDAAIAGAALVTPSVASAEIQRIGTIEILRVDVGREIRLESCERKQIMEHVVQQLHKSGVSGVPVFVCDGLIQVAAIEVAENACWIRCESHGELLEVGGKTAEEVLHLAKQVGIL